MQGGDIGISCLAFGSTLQEEEPHSTSRHGLGLTGLDPAAFWCHRHSTSTLVPGDAMAAERAIPLNQLAEEGCSAKSQARVKKSPQLFGFAGGLWEVLGVLSPRAMCGRCSIQRSGAWPGCWELQRSERLQPRAQPRWAGAGGQPFYGYFHKRCFQPSLSDFVPIRNRPLLCEKRNRRREKGFFAVAAANSGTHKGTCKAQYLFFYLTYPLPQSHIVLSTTPIRDPDKNPAGELAIKSCFIRSVWQTRGQRAACPLAPSEIGVPGNQRAVLQNRSER